MFVMTGDRTIAQQLLALDSASPVDGEYQDGIIKISMRRVEHGGFWRVQQQIMDHDRWLAPTFQYLGAMEDGWALYESANDVHPLRTSSSWIDLITRNR